MNRALTSDSLESAGIVLLAGASLLAGCRTASSGEGAGAKSDSQPAPASAPPGPVLEDQLGDTWSIDEVLAGPAFIIIGGVSASEGSTRWDLEVVGPVAARLGWSVHRILRLPSYPRLFRGAVVSRVRASARPQDAPILLDWDDRVAARLGCSAEGTTIVVLDSGGTELGRLRGDPDPSGRTELEKIAAAAVPTGGRAGSP